MIDERLVNEFKAMVDYLRDLYDYAKSNEELDDNIHSQLADEYDTLLGYLTDCYALKLIKSLESK